MAHEVEVGDDTKLKNEDTRSAAAMLNCNICQYEIIVSHLLFVTQNSLHTEFVVRNEMQSLLKRETGWLDLCSLPIQLCRKVNRLWMANQDCQSI